MLALAAALLLGQTYPLLTSATLGQGNTPGGASLSIIGAGEVDVTYSQSGLGSGSMIISATPVGPNGQATGSTSSATVNVSTGSTAIVINPFVGTGISVTWYMSDPTAYLAGVTLQVVARPSVSDGGTVTFTNLTTGGLAADAGSFSVVSATRYLTPAPQILACYAAANTILAVNSVLVSNAWPSTYSAAVTNFSGYVSTQGQGDTAGSQNVELEVTDGTHTCYVGLPCDAGIGLFNITAGDGTCSGLTGAILEVGPKDGGAVCTTLPKVDSVTVDGQLVHN